MLVSSVVSFLVLSMAVAAVSVTLTKSGIFEKPRSWIDAKNAFLGDLVHCPYCTSHWLSFLTVALYQPTFVSSGYVVADYAISAFAMIMLASYLGGVIIRAYSDD